MEAEHYPNGVLESVSTRIVNGAYKHDDLQTDESSMDDGHPRRQLCGGNQAATERIILFGRELQALSEQLGREYGKNLAHTEMLQVQDKQARTEPSPSDAGLREHLRVVEVGQNGLCHVCSGMWNATTELCIVCYIPSRMLCPLGCL